MRKNFALVGTAAAIAALSLTQVAKADILPAEVNPTSVTATGNGTFIWTYDVFVTDAQEVRTGNSFTFYDFAGFQGVASAPSGFASSVQAVSPPVTTNFGVILPNDSATLQNITFTYTGPTIVGNPTSLGSFALESTLGTTGARQTFVGQGTDRDSGLVNANITNYVAPVVPEPGEYAVAGVFAAGLLGLVLRARRRSSVSGLAA